MLINYSLTLILWIAILSCKYDVQHKALHVSQRTEMMQPAYVREIQLPKGFYHVKGSDTSFASWLLDQKIRDDKTVFLYNGVQKDNQQSQYAVLDIDIGRKDLVQCADAIMKLRADHLHQQGRHDKIVFLSTSGVTLSHQQWKDGLRWKQKGKDIIQYISTSNEKDSYASFMDFVYTYCGTYSLSRQMKVVVERKSIQAGDVFVQGGFPGHAVLVLSVARNNSGKIIFLLAQGYMPAQDIHILKNPSNRLSPWYCLEEIEVLVTPEWIFNGVDLKRW